MTDNSQDWDVTESFEDNSMSADMDVDITNSNVDSPFGDGNALSF